MKTIYQLRAEGETNMGSRQVTRSKRVFTTQEAAERFKAEFTNMCLGYGPFDFVAGRIEVTITELELADA